MCMCGLLKKVKYGITPNVGANIAIFSERSTSRCTKLRGLPPNGGLIDQKKNATHDMGHRVQVKDEVIKHTKADNDACKPKGNRIGHGCSLRRGRAICLV